MSFRSIALNGIPGAAKIYSNVVRHALAKRGSKRRPDLQALPKLTLQCNNITIDQNHVQCYSEVCGFASSRAPGQAPATYPFVLTFPLQMYLMSDEAFPHPLLGMVHLSNKIEQFGQLSGGSTVDATITLNDSYIFHEKGLCFSVTSEIFDSSSQKLLWRNECVMLQRMKVDIPNGEHVYDSKLKEPDMAGLTEIEKWSLSSNMGRKYALASGDYNPIHLSTLSARAFGFSQGAIIHGMWTKARAVASIVNTVPRILMQADSDSRRPILDVFVEFKTPLFLPGEVSFSKGTLPANDIAGVVTGADRDGTLFQVRSIGGEQLPHVRGICSWQKE